MSSIEIPQNHLAEIPPHHLKVTLIHPQIAPNTGNIARTCVVSGTELHLVRPLGFLLDDRKLRRGGMDYWPRLKLLVHDLVDEFFTAAGRTGGNPWLFASRARQSLWDVRFREDDWLVFGSETAGIPEAVRDAHPARLVRIPQAAGERCLNLSTAVGVALYEALRRISMT